MKHIKRYNESIDFDDIDDEEEEVLDVRAGEYLHIGGGVLVKFWSDESNPSSGYWKETRTSGSYTIDGGVKNIMNNKDSKNFDGYIGTMVKVGNHWPWFKLEDFKKSN